MFCKQEEILKNQILAHVVIKWEKIEFPKNDDIVLGFSCNTR
jgi:hypothetical protein